MCVCILLGSEAKRNVVFHLLFAHQKHKRSERHVHGNTSKFIRYLFVCVCVHVRECTCVYVYVYVHVYVCVCVTTSRREKLQIP